MYAAFQNKKGIESELLKREGERVQWAELCHSLSGGGLQSRREGERERARGAASDSRDL